MLSLEDRKEEIVKVFDRLRDEHLVPLCGSFEKELNRWISHCDSGDLIQLISETNNLLILLLGQTYAGCTYEIYKNTDDQELLRMLKDKFGTVLEDAWAHARQLEQQSESEAVN